MTDVQDFRITLTVDDFEAAVALTVTRSACGGLDGAATTGGAAPRRGARDVELFDERQADGRRPGRANGVRERAVALQAPVADDGLALTSASATGRDAVDTPGRSQRSRRRTDGMQLTLFTLGG